MTKRVNITFNSENPMDAMIIDLIGGEDRLTSKGIKSLLLHVAISGSSDSFIPLTRNINETKDKQKEIEKRNVLGANKFRNSNDNNTINTLNSNNEVTDMEQESNECDFEINVTDVEKNEVADDGCDIESLFNSMLKF